MLFATAAKITFVQLNLALECRIPVYWNQFPARGAGRRPPTPYNRLSRNVFSPSPTLKVKLLINANPLGNIFWHVPLSENPVAVLRSQPSPHLLAERAG